MLTSFKLYIKLNIILEIKKKYALLVTFSERLISALQDTYEIS